MPQESFEERLRRQASTPSAPVPTPTPTPAPLSFEQRLAQATQQQPQAPQTSAYETFKRNVGIASEQGYTALKDKAAALGEVIGGVTTGNFYPLIEAGQRIGHGVQGLATSLFGEAALTSPEFGAPTPTAEVPQILQRAQQTNAAALQNVQAQQNARRLASGDTSFQQRAAELARL